jgi:hypothetical protein
MELTRRIRLRVMRFDDAYDFYKNTIKMDVTELSDTSVTFKCGEMEIVLEKGAQTGPVLEYRCFDPEQVRQFLTRKGCEGVSVDPTSIEVRDPYGVRFVLSPEKK